MFMYIVALKITFIIAFMFTKAALIHWNIPGTLILYMPSKSLFMHVRFFANRTNVLNLVSFVCSHKHSAIPLHNVVFYKMGRITH